MFEPLVTVLSLASAVMLAVLIAFLYKLNRNIPDLLQDALNDVGGQLSAIFEKPLVKGAMSQMGKKSGEVRASSALKERVAEKALGSNVVLRKVLDYFDITPMEGIELMNDPMMGPVIRNLMAGFAKGGQGLLKGFGGSQSFSGNNVGGQRGRGVPLMS